MPCQTPYSDDLLQMPWKILIPHSTTTMADTKVAAVNTLSKEATLMTLSASYPANRSN
jgi:hypothetical protein